MPEKTDDPTLAGPHWGTTHPEDQPSRDQAAGLGRMVLEARNRLGPQATPEQVIAELKSAGVDASPADIAHWFEETTR